MSTELNQSVAAASLERMHDIIVPDPVGFLPPAPGWYIVFLLLMALLFYLSLQAYSRYKKRQYRRDALQELKRYREQNRESALALLALAKRVGIAAYGRKTVAVLSDEEWWEFMQRHSETLIEAPLRDEIRRLLYDERFAPDAALFGKIRAVVKSWIETHREAKSV